MAIGTFIRASVVVAWCAIASIHFVRYALPGLGISERRDLGATLTAQMDRTLVYNVLVGEQEYGHCRLSFNREEAGYLVHFAADLTALPLSEFLTRIPGLRTTEGSIHLNVQQRYDDRVRLTAVTADGQAFGIPLRANAVADASGLNGTVTIQENEHPFHLPATSGDDQSFALTPTLPPGLKPGDQFRTTMMTMGLTMTPQRVVAVYMVQAPEMIATAQGMLELMRVEMSSNGKAAGTLWCDTTGTIYRLATLSPAITLELLSITHASEGQLFPLVAGTDARTDESQDRVHE